MGFNDLDFKLKYTTYDDDVIEDFYVPILNHSLKYDRAVGYFSSSALLAYLKGIRTFVRNKGVMRLIISPILTSDDLDAITSNNYIENLTRKMFDAFLNDEISFKSSQILFLLLKSNNLIIKIAEPLTKRGLFHDKIGIFYDKFDDYIAISGSNNETLAALKYNTESFGVFKSYDSTGSLYAKTHRSDFERYWNNEIEHLNFVDINDVLPKDYIDKFTTDDSIDDLYEYILKDDEKQEPSKLKFTPWDNQIQAAKNWFLNEKGILEMATGTGKTKTAIYIHELLKQREDKLFTIVIVPDMTLLNQWNNELKVYNDWIMTAYSGNYKWFIELKDSINFYNYKEKSHNLVITTNNTFFSERFQSELKKLNNNYLLIVDEMHNWGTNKIIKNLPKYKYILGLSATPSLHFKEDLNSVLQNYFGGIIFKYNLEQAIKDGLLVPYTYHPIIVTLTATELENYDAISSQIARIIGSDESLIKDFNDPMLQQLLFKRSRIVYGAEEKTTVFKKIIKEIERKGRLVVYAGITSEAEVAKNRNGEIDEERKFEDIDEVFVKQIDEVGMILTQKQIKFSRYTSKESEEERMASIRDFSNDTYSTLLAIKCLDEGVDIPSIERAIILSSSQNPREFIQRRGRVLRKSTKTNKKIAEVYDFIVLVENGYSDYSTLNKKELERYFEFSRLSLNKNDLSNDYDYLTAKYVRKEDIYE